jgi:hypothetical protein
MTNLETTTTDKTVTVAAQGAHVAPENASSKKAATRKRDAAEGRKAAKLGKQKASKAKAGGKAKAAAPKKGAKASNKAAKFTAANKASAPRAESKSATILELISRTKGATLPEIMKATGWQPHSVRGFISTAAKKLGIKIESTKNEAGDRLYKTAK